MAIRRSFNGASIAKPGVYSRSTVNLAGGFPLSATGVVAIVGEALGGAPGSADGVQTFTSEDIRALVEKYKSGPIVDAARILIRPSNDARVPNGASIIRVYKTNASLQASNTFSNGTGTLFTITSKNYGEDENLIKVKVEAGVDPDARIITVTKSGQKEVLTENPRDVWMNLQYTGANLTATLTIQSNSLVISAGVDSLTIALAGKTLQDVVDLIDGSAVFTAATTLPFAGAKLAIDLDPISTPLDIKTTAEDLYAAQKELLDIINSESALISAARTTNVEGMIIAVTKFLNGGARGASTNSTFQAGFDALLALRCNTVIPLIAQDATDLALIGETDVASTFTVDAVNLQALVHCTTASNTKNRSERNCYVAKKDTFANAKIAAQNLNSERASMLFQDVEVLDSTGSLKFMHPWAAACIVAGIQAGTTVGTPATFKTIAVNGIQHEDYNPKTQVDLAIDAGLLPLEERDQGGYRVVVHNSTYGADANFVYNRPHVLEAADYVAYNLRQQLEAIFIGEKAATGTAESIKNTVVAIMSTFLTEQIIVGDDTNANLGYKDLTVSLNGNTALIDITITPVQGIDFILATITLDDIRQSA